MNTETLLTRPVRGRRSWDPYPSYPSERTPEKVEPKSKSVKPKPVKPKTFYERLLNDSFLEDVTPIQKPN